MKNTAGIDDLRREWTNYTNLRCSPFSCKNIFLASFFALKNYFLNPNTQNVFIFNVFHIFKRKVVLQRKFKLYILSISMNHQKTFRPKT